MSSSSPFGDPPPGTNLNENRNTVIYGSIIPVAVVATIVVALRTRLRTVTGKPSFKIDDFTVIVALFFTWGTAACCFLGMFYGLGKHIWVADLTKLPTLWIILYAYLMVYATSVVLTNMSILLFYRRIFRYELWFYIIGSLVVSYWIVIIVVINVGCQPLPYFWERFGNPNAVGKCIDLPKFFFANAIWALAVDMIVLVMPIPTVMRLQMPLRDRIAVIAILMLGGFVCIACVIRIISLRQFTSATDLTWAMAPVFVWSSVEPFVGLICACLPTFGPYYRKFWAKIHTSLSGGKSRGYASGPLNDTDGVIIGGRTSKDHHMQSKPARSRRFWGSRSGDMGLAGRLRDDDEVELTTEITGPCGGDGRIKTSSEGGDSDAPERGIRVKEEFVWTSTPTPTHDRK